MPFRRVLTFLLGLVVYLSISFAWAQGGWNSWSGKVTMGGNDAFHAQTGIYLAIVDPSMGLNPTRLKVRNGTKQPITVASPETTISEFEVAMGAEREIPLNPLKKGEYYTQIGVSVRYWQGPTPEELAQQQAAAQEKQAQEAKRAAEAQQQETKRRRQLAEKGQAQRKEFYDRKMAMVRQRNRQIDQSMSSLAGALVANMTRNKLQEQNRTMEHNLAQIRDGKMDACPSCDGTGFEDCSCGDGRQTCMACMGQGRVYGGAQCVTCQGSGRQFCMQCGGTLRVECRTCAGRGGTSVQVRSSVPPTIRAPLINTVSIDGQPDLSQTMNFIKDFILEHASIPVERERWGPQPAQWGTQIIYLDIIKGHITNCDIVPDKNKILLKLTAENINFSGILPNGKIKTCPNYIIDMGYAYKDKNGSPIKYVGNFAIAGPALGCYGVGPDSVSGQSPYPPGQKPLGFLTNNWELPEMDAIHPGVTIYHPLDGLLLFDSEENMARIIKAFDHLLKLAPTNQNDNWFK